MFDVPIHKLIVHFPVALMIIAAIYDAWAVYTRRPELHRLAYGLILWAAVGALAAEQFAPDFNRAAVQRIGFVGSW